MLATGIFLGVRQIKNRAEQVGLNVESTLSAVHWSLIPGFIGAYLLEILLYEPHRLFTEGFSVLASPNLSSYGGLFTSILGYLWWQRKYKPKNIPLLTDVLVEGAVIGFLFGRLGCAIVHDHPGIPTDFFLAVKYPDTPRHDLGFEEFLLIAFVLFPISQWFSKRFRRGEIPAGYQTALICTIYPPVRFFLEFLREDASVAGDTRYLGLTPAQYFSFIFFAIGIKEFIRLRKIEKPALQKPKGK